MARSIQRRKMGGKRKRTTKWGSQIVKRQRIGNALNTPSLSLKVGKDGSAYTTLTYVSVINKSVVSGALSSASVYRWTSVFDPDQTATGLQPYNFDQLSAIYAKYVVLGAKAFVEISVDGGNNSAHPVGIFSSENSTAASSNHEVLAETPGAASCLISREKPALLELNYSPKRDMGLSTSDDTLQAVTTANPSQNFYLHTFAQNQSASTTTFYFRVTIQYRVKFMRPLQNAGS